MQSCTIIRQHLSTDNRNNQHDIKERNLFQLDLQIPTELIIASIP